MMDINKLKEEVSIVDIAKDIGLVPIKIGNWYTLKEHDSVRIDSKKNLFIQNSTGIAGSVLDFLMLFGSMNLAEAISFCEKKGNCFPKREREIKQELEADEKNFILPQNDNNMKNVFAYLLRTRKISKEVVRDFVKNKNLYQDVKKNCVFVSYKNGEPIFACRRGTNTYKRFVGDVPYSDYRFGFFINNQSRTLIITESVIDIMSIMTIQQKMGNTKRYNYLALTGVLKWQGTVGYHILKEQYSKVIICLDNDGAGKKYSEEIKQFLLDKKIEAEIKMPVFKDFNEDLINFSK